MGNQSSNGSSGHVGGPPGMGGGQRQGHMGQQNMGGDGSGHHHQMYGGGAGSSRQGPSHGHYQGGYGDPQQQQQRGMRNSSSDASMCNADSTSGEAGGSSSANTTLDLNSLSAADDDTVPTVFRWEHGGRQVYITGTFNGWSRQIPMHRSGNDFTYIHNLRRGKHAFKFIVDDEWRFAPDQPTVADIDGRINNFIDVTDFKAYTGDKDFEREKAAAEYGCYYQSANPSQDNLGSTQRISSTNNANADDSSTVNKNNEEAVPDRPDPDGEVFSHHLPDLDEYTKEPPPLPPHLRHIILNKPPQLQDTAALPVPQHVALNHLYCTAIRDNMMVLGITQRFKTKFVTTVYYSPCSS